MKQFVFNIIYIISIICFFTTCKKYPKNWLLFNSPEKVLARGTGRPWIMNGYWVNGNDSLFADYLKTYKNEGLIIPETAKKSGEQKYNCLDIIYGFWEFTNKKKIIHFKFSDGNFHNSSNVNPNYINQRNIFLTSGQEWNIDKLTKDDFWIISEYNNVKYEIHFK